MKRILITGAGGYIGGAAQRTLEEAGHTADVLDMTGGAWEDFDFSGYDAVFHTAGIAHNRRLKKNSPLYFSVNTELALRTAQRAKDAGVRQFVFMSSMAVYGASGVKNITAATVPKARDGYGLSKLRAEEGLTGMSAEGFETALIRAPMVFGRGCKGNFPRLVRLTERLPLFPDIRNKRSMVYIENLCAFVKHVIESGEGGVFFPQNPDYFCTSDLVGQIAAEGGKKIRITKLFNWAVWLAYPFSGALRKLFSSLTYDKTLSAHINLLSNTADNGESVRRSVGTDGG